MPIGIRLIDQRYRIRTDGYSISFVLLTSATVYYVFASKRIGSNPLDVV